MDLADIMLAVDTVSGDVIFALPEHPVFFSDVGPFRNLRGIPVLRVAEAAPLP